ncbi:hypothetical protein NQ317_019533 [Molorchus minor]|uniref:Glutamate--tRNA ligase, mitochondrial n=1 Tax=Molorchus minor TaxID=1323400 RepID=A0ABQ9IZL9_9CUCU|nr:hypothetical protein NQ317_019533 [Molorchus minor]
MAPIFNQNNGTAYYCFCTEKRLQLLRREALRLQEIPKYDNRCRHLTHDVVQSKLDKGESSCIRFKMSDKEETFEDLIYGRISYNISLNEGDPVIIKSDGYPTYHFANVVDDHLMKVTHVLRGVEWQISTTKHILLYRAFNWNPPLYGHLPLLMNADGTKLSKRQGDIKISYYKDNYIFPLALINFIVHSGGGFTKDLERHMKPSCYSTADLANQNSKEEKELISRVRKMVEEKYHESIKTGSLQLNTSEEHIKNILHWASNRIEKLDDLLSKNLEFIWTIPKAQDIKNYDASLFELLRTKLKSQDEFSIDRVSTLLKAFCMENEVKYSNFMKTLRSVLSGLKEGPSVAEMIVILGKENTLQRLQLYQNNTRNFLYWENMLEYCEDSSYDKVYRIVPI